MSPRVLPVLLSLFALAAAQTARETPADFDRWYSLETALELAESHERPVMVYFYSEHCPFCRQMNSFVFAAPDVSEALREYFVVATVDIDSKENAQLVKRYRVRGTPTFVFLEDEGEWLEASRLFGSQPRDIFLERLNEVR